jgi:hypothetical protein
MYTDYFVAEPWSSLVEDLVETVDFPRMLQNWSRCMYTDYFVADEPCSSLVEDLVETVDFPRMRQNWSHCMDTDYFVAEPCFVEDPVEALWDHYDPLVDSL